MSHKNYQSILPCSNKLLKKQWDTSYYEEHRRRVRAMRPMVDTKSPAVHSHVVEKQKKKQLEAERKEIIERDNLTLLRKMNHIMSSSSSKGIDHRNSYRHHSLNEERREREMERVQKENESLLKRIQQVKPVYRVDDHVESWRRNAELTEMISSYPELPRPRHRTEKSKTRPPTREGEKVEEEEQK
ncbi:PREDICTED: uncharacterized protein C17orf105 homolog [Amphimedon queenslandica]|uniref:Cilia- and flagella-associated protein 97 n=1 Tax=Amphimedon queenslandica TaxID=400682 RepID=A0A1X7U3R3_AMPQE|nr:PREDICTED: uncharacterized protein C17orf105 homolog [Amphimedon queenslandica]|eukprot:XP_003389065.1 PREDICTED: uncharacterized protein C17orf105 homolog [Amphimedon queenslandica]